MLWGIPVLNLMSVAWPSAQSIMSREVKPSRAGPDAGRDPKPARTGRYLRPHHVHLYVLDDLRPVRDFPCSWSRILSRRRLLVCPSLFRNGLGRVACPWSSLHKDLNLWRPSNRKRASYKGWTRWPEGTRIREPAPTILWAAVSLHAVPSCTRGRSSACMPPQLTPGASAKDVVATVASNEQIAALHSDHYSYFSVNGPTAPAVICGLEKVVETNAGKVRLLLEEDGQPLSAGPHSSRAWPARRYRCRSRRLPEEIASGKDDEAHARQLLTLLPKAFLFSEPRQEGELSPHRLQAQSRLPDAVDGRARATRDMSGHHADRS